MVKTAMSSIQLKVNSSHRILIPQQQMTFLEFVSIKQNWRLKGRLFAEGYAQSSFPRELKF